MKIPVTEKHSHDHAVEALETLLRQVSAIRLKQIRKEGPGSRKTGGESILVDVEVYGHSHLLVCSMHSCDHAADVRAAIDSLRRCAERAAADATPVLMAASLSDEAQALCSSLKTSYMDLKGNARLELGEFFIACHSHRQRIARRIDRPTPEIADCSILSTILPEGLEIHPNHSVAAVPFS
jgi:hypothetical protein